MEISAAARPQVMELGKAICRQLEIECDDLLPSFQRVTIIGEDNSGVGMAHVSLPHLIFSHCSVRDSWLEHDLQNKKTKVLISEFKESFWKVLVHQQTDKPLHDLVPFGMSLPLVCIAGTI